MYNKNERSWKACKINILWGGGAHGNEPLSGKIKNGAMHVDMLVKTRNILPVSGQDAARVKPAFTLAEVLITLGIIGVVAAMTLPTLIQNKHHRELETALKKNYSNIQNALNLMAYERGEKINYSTFSGPESFKKEFIKYFKAAKDCGYRGCIDHEGDPDADGTVYITKKYRNFTNTNYVASFLLDDGQFMLRDGAMIYIEQPNASELKRLFILVDVNGLSKGPNRFGHDLFTFQVHYDSGKLLPIGAEDTDGEFNNSEYCSNTGTSSVNGIACTYSALTDKDYWKNLPK